MGTTSENILIPPYGGKLINLLAAPEECEELRARAHELTRVPLQRAYDHHRQAMEWMSRWGNVENWPFGMPLFESPIPGDTVTFYQFSPKGNIANFEDRWRWISESIMPSWKKLTEQNPGHVLMLIDRLIQQGKQ